MLQTIPQPVRAQLTANMNSLHQGIRRRCAQSGQHPPTPVDTNFVIPPQYEGLVLFNNFQVGLDNSNRMLIIGNRDLLGKLAQADEWHGNGTFKTASPPFKQEYLFIACQDRG